MIKKFIKDTPNIFFEKYLDLHYIFTVDDLVDEFKDENNWMDFHHEGNKTNVLITSIG